MTNDLRFNYTDVTAANVGTFDAVGGATPITKESDAATYALMFPVAGFTPANESFIMNLDSANLTIGIIANNENQQYKVGDTLSIVHDNHQIKVGVDFRRLLPSIAQANYQNLYTFASGPAPAFNDPLVKGTVTSYQTAANPTKLAFYENFGFFAQDTWKITRRLTLTYGFRWDINPAPPGTSATPMYSLSAINPANVAATTVNFGQPLYPTQWDALAPRVGIAYQLSQGSR